MSLFIHGPFQRDRCVFVGKPLKSSQKKRERVREQRKHFIHSFLLHVACLGIRPRLAAAPERKLRRGLVTRNEKPRKQLKLRFGAQPSLNLVSALRGSLTDADAWAGQAGKPRSDG